MKKDKSKKEKKKNKKKKQSEVNESIDTLQVSDAPELKQSEKKGKKKKKSKKKDTDKTKNVKAKSIEKIEKADKVTAAKAPESTGGTEKASEDKTSDNSAKTETPKRAERKKTVKTSSPVHQVKSETVLSVDKDAPSEITSVIASAVDTLYSFFSEPYTLKDGSTLSPAEARTLSFICDEDGATLTMIALNSGATKSAVTKPVNRLIDKNMLVRKPMPGNGREKLIVPTKKGKAALDEMKIIKSNRLGKLVKLEADLTDSQIKGLKHYLEALFSL